tara:strand:+ start:112 stop:1620 length:1509 start_codon:yes stop_codon:yes gene_type:complete
MAQYYDPREASTTFSLYANIAQTQRQEEEAEKKKKIGTAKSLMTPLKMLEAKRTGDITDQQTLLAELDKDTITGKAFKSKEYIAPERKEYDPRKLSDWLNKRYGRSGRERVEYQELTPEAKKRGEIYGFRPGGPEGGQQFDPNVAIEKSVAPLGTRNPYYAEQKQLEQLSNPSFRHGEFDSEAYKLGMEGKAETNRFAKRGEERYLHQIETETYKKEYDRLKGMPKSEMKLELGITDPTHPAPPPPLGDVSSNVNFLPQTPGNLMEQAQAGLTGNVPPPQVDPSNFVGRYDLSKDLETGRTYQSASKGFGEAADKQGRLHKVLEGRQKQSPIPGNKVITQAPSDQPISSLLGGKGLLDGSVSQEYGSFNELVSARNAARGTEGFGVIQEQVSQYMPKGTSYGEAAKAFDAAKTAETAAAVETGSEVIGAAGETAGGFTPGIGEALAVKEVGEIWGESGGRGEDKIKATGGTAADLASSYAIASGNPYAMVGGALWKGYRALT